MMFRFDRSHHETNPDSGPGRAELHLPPKSVDVCVVVGRVHTPSCDSTGYFKASVYLSYPLDSTRPRRVLPQHRYLYLPIDLILRLRLRRAWAQKPERTSMGLRGASQNVQMKIDTDAELRIQIWIRTHSMKVCHGILRAHTSRQAHLHHHTMRVPRPVSPHYLAGEWGRRA